MHRFGKIVAVCGVAWLGACASASGPHIIKDFAAAADVAAMTRAIQLDTPKLAEFDAIAGDDQPLEAIGYARGIIRPHFKANKGGLRNGKVLARISVEKDYPALGLKAKVSNWWVMEQRAGVWYSLMVAADGTSKELPLSTRTHHPVHKIALARWLSHSSEIGWATCDGGTCCCSGSGCDTYLVDW